MKKQVDFRREKLLRDQWYRRQQNSIDPKHKEEELALITKIFRLESERRKNAKDHPRRVRLEEEYFPLICRFAEENGGRVELEIDEDSYYGSLTYWGDSFVSDTYLQPSLHTLAKVISDSDALYIAREGNLIKLQLSYELLRKDLIAPPSSELIQLYEQLEAMHTAHRKQASVHS